MKMAGGFRLDGIDRLRGAVMVLMLVDHVREFFYLHRQVADPMDLATTSPELFFTRLASHLCAPVFVLLTGLGAWLHASRHHRRETSAYLLKRGLILILLELSLVNFAWTFSFPPRMIYLQVIWAIGLAMLALALLLWLPRIVQIGLAAGLIGAHNLLDGIHFLAGEAGYVPWAILHARSVVELTDHLAVRTSYPVLPWIGIILLGYLLGPLYARDASPGTRRQRLVGLGGTALLAYLALRWLNVYGDAAWQVGATPLASLMSFLNVTKYPPSLHFSLLTLGFGLLALAGLERWSGGRMLVLIGRVPLFFYIAHLYLLHAIYLLFAAVLGPNQAVRFGFAEVWMIWAMVPPVLAALYLPCRWFGQLKQEGRYPWLRYF